MLCLNATAVVFDDFVDQQMLICVDDVSQVTVLPAEAAYLADWEPFGDLDEQLIRQCGEEVFVFVRVGILSVLCSRVTHLFRSVSKDWSGQWEKMPTFGRAAVSTSLILLQRAKRSIVAGGVKLKLLGSGKYFWRSSRYET